MRKLFIVLSCIIGFAYAQNYDSFLSHKSKPVEIGIYPLFLNYGNENHFHQMISVGFGLTARDKIIFKGGLFTETRFELSWFRKIYVHPFYFSFSPGIGSMWGTFLDLDAGIAIPFSHGVYLNNELQVNLYLDTDNGKPFQSDSPLWYIINFHAPLGKASQLHAEFGLPLGTNTYTFFGAGLKFFF
jgi:hypothetical protein